ncbi:hypothetical protein HNY73_022553 [Argiope bruennichi]|uniref:Uncharacterized protein n=1 Tax=Argiope bruennichi TaxID=94029 RepID=A0A8T0E2S9_ARGBR|nr:hypothetical protein HNY73_022553 [Argiope bruennichi]
MITEANAMMFKILLLLGCVHCIWSHARLMEPPSRSSMWRHGYDTPKNYDDDGLYCGGMHVLNLIFHRPYSV